jgi:HlyD family secretion protein
MAIWRRHIAVSLGLTIIAVIIGLGFVPRPVLVTTVPAQRGPLQVTVEEEGRTRVIDRFVISAPVAGFSRRIELKVGDPVQQGQVLAWLEPLRAQVLDPRSRAEAESRAAAARAALQSAEESVQAADADARYAAAELERLERLYETRIISFEALQQAQTSARRTQANLQSARFNVQVARYELQAAEAALRFSAAERENGVDAPETVAVRAPVGGRVLKIIHESEGVVQSGQALLELGDPRSLEVEVDVLSRDAVRIEPGTRVLLDRWGGAGLLEGAVRTVEPVGFTKVSALGVEEQRVLVIVDISSPPELWERLGDGYRVEAAFVLWEQDDVLQVPSSALFRHGGGWALFVVEDDRARLREVEIGRRSGLAAQILSGIDEGSIVVAHPGDAVSDRTRVRPR